MQSILPSKYTVNLANLSVAYIYVYISFQSFTILITVTCFNTCYLCSLLLFFPGSPLTEFASFNRTNPPTTAASRNLVKDFIANFFFFVEEILRKEVKIELEQLKQC